MTWLKRCVERPPIIIWLRYVHSIEGIMMLCYHIRNSLSCYTWVLCIILYVYIHIFIMYMYHVPFVFIYEVPVKNYISCYIPSHLFRYHVSLKQHGWTLGPRIFYHQQLWIQMRLSRLCQLWRRRCPATKSRYLLKICFLGKLAYPCETHFRFLSWDMLVKLEGNSSW